MSWHELTCSSYELGLPFYLETDLEQLMAGETAWQDGLEYGKPRPGHPEGQVKFHIAEVLGNIDRIHADGPFRRPLRLIALLHDTFKYKVDRTKPKTGENHHGMLARRFAENFIDEEDVLDVIELHDEAYNAWCLGVKRGKMKRAVERAIALRDRLGDNMDLYLAFYDCDNATGDKDRHDFDWFRDVIVRPQESS